MFYIIYINMCVCEYRGVYMYVAFSDSRMLVALSGSQELDVHPGGKQIGGGDDWYVGFERLENCASSTIGQ